ASSTKKSDAMKRMTVFLVEPRSRGSLHGDGVRDHLGGRDVLLPGPPVLEAELLSARLERRELPDLDAAGAGDVAAGLRSLISRGTVHSEDRVLRLDVDPAIAVVGLLGKRTSSA